MPRRPPAFFPMHPRPSRARFLTPLRVEKIGEANGRPVWRLIGPLEYVSPILGGRVAVPTGFLTDLASTPRLPLMFMLAGDTAHEAGVIHDYGYVLQWGKRSKMDAVLEEAMQVCRPPEPWWRRQMMWSAVRVAGWAAWKSEDPESLASLDGGSDAA